MWYDIVLELIFRDNDNRQCIILSLGDKNEAIDKMNSYSAKLSWNTIKDYTDFAPEIIKKAGFYVNEVAESTLYDEGYSKMVSIGKYIER